jgi:hypothetical protein
MLRAHARLDIEDHGCSGETFLAAVELIKKYKPSFCIFEHVLNAPWAKMQEYIEGKVKLASCDGKKAIKGATKKDGKALEFALTDEGDIVVDRVPPWFGVQCGVAVAGVQKPGSTTLQKVTWPPKCKKSCTLEDLV